MERSVHESFLSIDSYDADYTSFYPSIMVFSNSSRATLSSALINVSSGISADDLSSKVVLLKENAVTLGKDYLNLPGYAEMKKLMAKEMKI